MRKLQIIEQKRLHIRPTILDVPAQSLRAREAEWELGTFATDNEFFADEFNMTEICSRRVITVASPGFGTRRSGCRVESATFQQRIPEKTGRECLACRFCIILS
jgi:hypothetical protein